MSHTKPFTLSESRLAEIIDALDGTGGVLIKYSELRYWIEKIVNEDRVNRNGKGVAVQCQYCEKNAVLITGAELYPNIPELKTKYFYRCKECDAHVGCHPGTQKPLGTLAKKELRQARNKAHSAFDPLWKKKAEMSRIPEKDARIKGYKWLAEQMGIPSGECHISKMTIEQCNRVVELCKVKK